MIRLKNCNQDHVLDVSSHVIKSLNDLITYETLTGNGNLSSVQEIKLLKWDRSLQYWQLSLTSRFVFGLFERLRTGKSRNHYRVCNAISKIDRWTEVLLAV